MPDSDGKLSKEEYQKAVDWINTKWEPGVQCEMCGVQQQWKTGQYIVTPLNMQKEVGRSRLLNFYYPQIQVMCTNCGNTKYINAFIAGIISKDESKNV